eukprot:6111395-Pleurochrysis_carterae.AAC.1
MSTPTRTARSAGRSCATSSRPSCARGTARSAGTPSRGPRWAARMAAAPLHARRRAAHMVGTLGWDRQRALQAAAAHRSPRFQRNARVRIAGCGRGAPPSEIQ